MPGTTSRVGEGAGVIRGSGVTVGLYKGRDRRGCVRLGVSVLDGPVWVDLRETRCGEVHKL